MLKATDSPSIISVFSVKSPALAPLKLFAILWLKSFSVFHYSFYETFLSCLNSTLYVLIRHYEMLKLCL